MSHNEMEGRHVKVMSQYNAQCFAIREALKMKRFINSNVTTAVSSQGNKRSEFLVAANILSYFSVIILCNAFAVWKKNSYAGV